MLKWPKKIIKQKISFKTTDNESVTGEVWFDRWHENVWFFGKFKSKYGLFVPLQWDRIYEKLKFTDQMHLWFKLIYSEQLSDVILPSKNPFLQLVPKTNQYKPVLLPLLKLEV